MVEENLKDYLESFLFALSLAYNIDIPKLQLKAQAATVALKFAERVQQRDELQQRDTQRLSQRTVLVTTRRLVRRRNWTRPRMGKSLWSWSLCPGRLRRRSCLMIFNW